MAEPEVVQEPPANGHESPRRETGEMQNGNTGDDASNNLKRKRDDANEHRETNNHKRKETGRREYERSTEDRRARIERTRAKTERINGPSNAVAVDGEKEDRKPKRKVAVMIGYSGTGYKGMQISPGFKTIEGDLFEAFVKAGAISKANADDPKKSTLVRCARTDKGVHAAGNMISLKLIVEDPDIVKRINDELSPQIRVWAIERTVNSFSCYQSCDSRWYEYLIPSHASLPPHPSTFLAKQLEKSADETGDRKAYDLRQQDVASFWKDADQSDIKPILDSFDQDIRNAVTEALYKSTTSDADADIDADKDEDSAQPTAPESNTNDAEEGMPESAADVEQTQTNNIDTTEAPTDATALDDTTAAIPQANNDTSKHPKAHFRVRLADAIRRVKTAYETTKRTYRISDHRMKLIQQALDQYTGTHNFHNFTVQKSPRDPSATRHIKSCLLNTEPLYIDPSTGQASTVPIPGATQWLSIKLHGQSFMMHQIRKMIGLATLLVRCGADVSTRIPQAYGDAQWAIPKVPGLGLLLERPVFETYNTLTAPKHDRAPLGFEAYQKEMEEFKKREIYKRIFEEEAKENTFQTFFNHLDNYAQPTFLYVTSRGHEATTQSIAPSTAAVNDQSNVLSA